ncbi:MAG: hypothetical protein IPL61_18715 [Myxococcales bacterium]|nr:hypothetical protein [Myxococcales bacterium]
MIGTYLGRTYKHRLFRTGALVAIDRSGAGRDATFDDFGRRVLLVRYTAHEIVAAQG